MAKKDNNPPSLGQLTSRGLDDTCMTQERICRWHQWPKKKEKDKTSAEEYVASESWRKEAIGGTIHCHNQLFTHKSLCLINSLFISFLSTTLRIREQTKGSTFFLLLLYVCSDIMNIYRICMFYSQYYPCRVYGNSVESATYAEHPRRFADSLICESH